MADVSVMTFLRGESSVTSVATGKIRCGMLDERDADRSIVIERASNRPLTHSTGANTTKFAELDVLCIATEYGIAETIADAVEDALGAWTTDDNASGGTLTAVSLLGTNYEPGPPIPGQDKLRSIFNVRVQVDYT